jgi:hypothetical protein
MSGLYRVRQFLLAAGALLQPRGLTDPSVGRLLRPAGVELFNRMPRYDRRHAQRVMGALQEQGQRDPDLLAAALLHDVGKTGSEAGRLRLWHRVVMVLLGAFAPRLRDRMGLERGGGWRQAFFVQVHHAQLGADLALKAGCSHVTVELIRCHELPCVPERDPRGEALRAADAAN